MNKRMYIHVFMDTCRYVHVPIGIFKGCFQTFGLTSVLLKLKLKFSLETFIIIRWFVELYFSSAGEAAAAGDLPASTWQIFIC